MSTSIATFIDNLKELENLAANYIGTKSHPEYYNSKRLVLGFIRRETYYGLNWLVSTGTSIDSGFVSYVRSKNKYLVKFFGDEDSDGNNVNDPQGQKINAIHLCACFEVIVYGDVPSEWAGWGGDIATGSRDIHNERKDETADISASRMAKKIIGNERFTCSFTDIVSDIDAVLIEDIRSSIENLSDTFKKYYKKSYKYRFKDFVDYYGGKRKFETKVEDILDSKILRSQLTGDATNTEIEAACDRFIEIVYENM